MKYRLSPKLVEVAHKVSLIPGMKSLLKPFYYKYKEFLEKKRRKMLQDNAYLVMSDFDKALKSCGISYSIAFGTLLGAVREKGLIKHDLDLDTMILYENYSENIKKSLASYGFRLSHVYMLDEGKSGLEETYEKNNVSIDIFYFYPAINEYPYTCLWNAVEDSSTISESMKKFGYVDVGRLELPLSKDTELVKFGPLYLPAICNYSLFLEKRYGKDYMIPNSKWFPSDKDSCYVNWPEKKGKYIEF